MDEGRASPRCKTLESWRERAKAPATEVRRFRTGQPALLQQPQPVHKLQRRCASAPQTSFRPLGCSVVWQTSVGMLRLLPALIGPRPLCHTSLPLLISHMAGYRPSQRAAPDTQCLYRLPVLAAGLENLPRPCSPSPRHCHRRGRYAEGGVSFCRMMESPIILRAPSAFRCGRPNFRLRHGQHSLDVRIRIEVAPELHDSQRKRKPVVASNFGTVASQKRRERHYKRGRVSERVASLLHCCTV